MENISQHDAEALVQRLWPGGGDRSEPAAREWLRRWRPARAFPLEHGCDCSAGRCGYCN
jgi:hypothetical protein